MDSEIENSSAPIMEHLVELRTRIIRSLIAFLITMSISFYFADDVFNFLSLPIISLLNSYGQNTELIYTGLQQGFMVHIKISIFAGFLFAFPFISFQLWRFVAPGMYKNEKKAFLPFLISSPLLFILGAVKALVICNICICSRKTGNDFFPFGAYVAGNGGGAETWEARL